MSLAGWGESNHVASGKVTLDPISEFVAFSVVLPCCHASINTWQAQSTNYGGLEVHYFPLWAYHHGTDLSCAVLANASEC